MYFNKLNVEVPPPLPEPPDNAEDDSEPTTSDFLVHEAPILDGELVVRPNFITQAAPVSPTRNFHWKFWAFLATALIGFALSQSVSAFWIVVLVLSVAVCSGIAVYFVCANSLAFAEAEELDRRNREHVERVQEIFAFREAKIRDVQRKLQTFRTETLAETQYLSDIKQRLREAEEAQRQRLNEEFETARQILLDFERRLREEDITRQKTLNDRVDQLEEHFNRREIEQNQQGTKHRVIAEEIARHYLTLVRTDVAKKLNPNNYATCKERLTVGSVSVRRSYAVPRRKRSGARTRASSSVKSIPRQ